jgi:hypothetical protein
VGHPHPNEVCLEEDALVDGDFMMFLNGLENDSAGAGDCVQLLGNASQQVQTGKTAPSQNELEEIRLEKVRDKNRRGQARYREKCRVC